MEKTVQDVLLGNFIRNIFGYVKFFDISPGFGDIYCNSTGHPLVIVTYKIFQPSYLLNKTTYENPRRDFFKEIFLKSIVSYVNFYDISHGFGDICCNSTGYRK